MLPKLWTLSCFQNYDRLSAMFAHFATTTGLTTPNDKVIWIVLIPMQIILLRLQTRQDLIQAGQVLLWMDCS